MGLAARSRVGNYVLLGELARGGQGAVYKARHAELGSMVAIKLLLAEDPDSRRRFRQEAKTLAHLRHPNLIGVPDSGALPDGTPYMAMDLVDGEDLKARVARTGPPALAEVARVLGALADTLEYCHAHGVVHRDVKPQNVLIERGTGRVVLIDFGLIKRDRLVLAWSTQDGASLTQEGELMGTPAYMPPEQADPSFGEIGPRSDVYALGATLYFLLTGEPPFQGVSALNIISDLMQAPAPDPRRANPAVPAALAELCARCMAKRPGDRPISAAAFAEALRAATSAQPTRPASTRRLAMALAVASGIGGIAGAGWIVHARSPRAIARPEAPATAESASEARYPQDPAPRPATAEEYLQRGSARAQQGDAAGALADFDQAIALDPRLAQAYSNRGFARVSLDQHQAAIADCDRAIALDPRLASAYSNRGRARWQLGQHQAALADYDQAIALDPYTEAYVNRGNARALLGQHQAAIADFDHALALDPRLPLAYVSRGFARENLGQKQAAIADYDQAIALDPRYARAYVNRGGARWSLGQVEAAIADYDRAIDLDPRDTQTYVNRGAARTIDGQHQAAIADFDRAIDLDPRNALAYFSRGLVHGKLGQHQAAIASYDQVIALDPRHAPAYANRGLARASLGQSQAAIADYERFLELEPQNPQAGDVLHALDRLRGLLAGQR